MRSRRLRKKLFLEEFAIDGFEFSCDLINMDEARFDQFFDDFLEFISERNLYFCGCGDKINFEGMLCANGRYDSATNDDIAAINNWLSLHNNVSNIVMGQLIDANYGI
ncbi:hypothetical protein PALB_12880 [Pseudoalteromonas luteoviolacea B = ATCC 29581]|nr:hypothetical protein PALB_12880 [Pseudoalteromonas luteoviolacea B = ATCC 29581]